MHMQPQQFCAQHSQEQLDKLERPFWEYPPQ